MASVARLASTLLRTSVAQARSALREDAGDLGNATSSHRWPERSPIVDPTELESFDAEAAERLSNREFDGFDVYPPEFKAAEGRLILADGRWFRVDDSLLRQNVERLERNGYRMFVDEIPVEEPGVSSRKPTPKRR